VPTSRFLAQLIGPTLLMIGLGILANRDGYRAMAHEFLQSRALIYLAGLLALVPGLAIVLTHNVWALDWRVLITILGWLSVVGGVFRVLFPLKVMAVGEKMVASPGYMLVGGVVALALGVILSVVGYVA
jgi:hypothetical protein